jgi:hypothetical protein
MFMTQTREHARPATPKAERRLKSGVARQAATGQFVAVQAGDTIAQVPVTKARFQRIAQRKRELSKMISGYADAAAKAEQTGKDHIIAFRVTPDGQAVEIATTVPAEPSPLTGAVSRAIKRGAIKIADILRGDDMLTARDFGPLIGASHETVNIKRKRHEVLGLEGATRGVKYPRWQVTDAGLPLPGLQNLFEALGAEPWTVFRFLKTRHSELGGQTALDALKAGRIEAVLDVAANQASGAFS